MNARDRAYKPGKSRKTNPTWKFLSSLVKRLMRKRKREYVAHKLNKATSSKAWWKSVRDIEGKQQEKISNHHLIDNQWISTPEFVSRLNEYFVTVGGDRDMSARPSVLPQALQPVSIGQVKLLLKKIDTTKENNSDDFPSWISKAAAKDICVPVTNIINTMLASNKYPSAWKKAEIRPLKKVKNPDRLSQYRPISLLHHIGKVAEEIIPNKLRNAIGEKLNKNQYAYQKQLSTTDALLHAVHDWCQDLDDNTTSHITTALIDMSKAFDRLNPNIIISKLTELNVNSGLVTLIDDFLSDRQCRVKLQEKSVYRDITMGTPQGTKLGPWLWLVYINEFGVPSSCRVIKYADDLTLYAKFKKSDQSTASNFQHALNSISDWALNNNMLINAEKTQIVHLSLSEPKYIPSFTMNGKQLQSTSNAKLLGVTIDAKLSFSKHIQDTCEGLAGRMYGMRELKRLGLNSQGLTLYYTANIRSVLTYACPVWGSLITDKDKETIRRIEGKAMRIINSDISYEQALCQYQVPAVDWFITDLSRKTMLKIYSNTNHPLSCVIKRKTTRQTRVSKMIQMPKCRTEKLKRSFFHHYSDF